MREQNRPERYIGIMNRLHAVVPLALLVPLLALIPSYAMNAAQLAALEYRMISIYLSGLLLAVPAALVYLAEMKIPGFLPFILTAVVLILLGLAGMIFFGKATGLFVVWSFLPVDLVILIIFLFDALSIRFNNNSRIRSRREGDLSWTQDRKLLSRPSAFQFIWFAVIYTVSLAAHSRGLGNAALTGAVLYFFLFLPYLLLKRRADYLENRKHVRGMPVRRIRRLTNRILLTVLIPAGLLAVAAFLTAGGRHYIQLPSFWPILDESMINNGMFEPNYLLREILKFLNLGEQAVPPVWLVYLFSFLENVLTVFCVSVIAYGIFKLIRYAAAQFRGIEREERRLKYTDDTDEHISLRKAPSEPLTRYGSGVRRRYRKTILRFRGSAPYIHETPEEMERLAGVPDTEDMRALHTEYESIRYGRVE